MQRSLVGSEMCIRDSLGGHFFLPGAVGSRKFVFFRVSYFRVSFGDDFWSDSGGPGLRLDCTGMSGLHVRLSRGAQSLEPLTGSAPQTIPEATFGHFCCISGAFLGPWGHLGRHLEAPCFQTLFQGGPRILVHLTSEGLNTVPGPRTQNPDCRQLT